MNYSNAVLEESATMYSMTPSAEPRVPLQVVHEDSSSYTGNQRWRVELELWKVYDDCKVDDWDGYGAIGVSKEGYEVAREFLEQLPNFIANPEVSADPDGEISFEWFKSNDVIFAVSISSSLKLSFAGTFHSESVLGIENFGLEIPQAILKPLSKHFSGSSTTSI